MSLKHVLLTAAALAALGAFGIATNPVLAKDDAAQAASADSGTMDRADRDMRKVLEKLGALGGKPIETLTAAEARTQPGPADAVKALMVDKGDDPEKEKAKMKVIARDLTYPAAAGEQPARIYRPEKVAEDEKLPVILYIHGGGWVLATIDAYDATPRSIAKQARAIVVSIEYRKAPEYKFPAAHDDAVAAYEWVLANAASWGGDPAKIAVMGESAGANLAANVAIAARDRKLQMPVAMALVYPVAGNDMDTKSYQQNVNAKPLNKAMMQWFVQQATASPDDVKDPRINLLAANLIGLPPATVVTADIDPLRSEGKALADRLLASGVNTDYKNYEGVTHEFFGMAPMVGKAKDAQEFVVDHLENAFDE